MRNKEILVPIVGVLALAFVFVSPVIESSQDAIILDMGITKTCWDRHGFNLPARWSCRSSLQRAGIIAMSMACAANKGGDKSDLCDNLDKLSEENKRRRHKTR